MLFSFSFPYFISLWYGELILKRPVLPNINVVISYGPVVFEHLTYRFEVNVLVYRATLLDNNYKGYCLFR